MEKTDSLISTDLFQQIANSSATTANNTSLGSYDWITLFIASIALIIAIYSLYYAIITLRVSRAALLSQERTEFNTRKVSFEDQKYLLTKLGEKIYQNICDILATIIFLEERRYTCYPNISFFNRIRLFQYLIQENSDTKNQNELYLKLIKIKELINSYNMEIVTSSNIIKKYDISIKEKQNYFEKLLAYLFYISNNVNNIFKTFYQEIYYDEIFKSIESFQTEKNATDIVDLKVYHFLHTPKIEKYLKEYVEIIFNLVSKKSYKPYIEQKILTVVSKNLKILQYSFIPFTIDDYTLTNKSNFGLFLPIPCTDKKYHYGMISIYIHDNKLFLNVYISGLDTPRLTLNNSEIINFEIYNENIFIIDFRNFNNGFNKLLTSKSCKITILDYKKYNESNKSLKIGQFIYQFKLNVNDIHWLINRATNCDFINNRNNMEMVSSKNYYEVLKDDKGRISILLYVSNKNIFAKASLPLFILDKRQQAILYKNCFYSENFGIIDNNFYNELMKSYSVTIHETEPNSENIICTYEAPIRFIESINKLVNQDL